MAMFRSVLMSAAILALALPAAAQDSGSGCGNSTDRVSGYRCVEESCITVRIPDTNCICQKQNPGETRLSQLRLKCTTKEGGEWVACAVKPRYGILVN
jgi:hypothetical protein